MSAEAGMFTACPHCRLLGTHQRWCSLAWPGPVQGHTSHNVVHCGLCDAPPGVAKEFTATHEGKTYRVLSLRCGHDRAEAVSP